MILKSDGECGGLCPGKDGYSHVRASAAVISPFQKNSNRRATVASAAQKTERLPELTNADPWLVLGSPQCFPICPIQNHFAKAMTFLTSFLVSLKRY
jgi:hypothetical protein